jgi:C-terminal processing protease CtpA/Prc
MSEMTAVGAKVVDNAKVVGTRTWGGLCGLMGNDAYSVNYAGHIGVEGETPVYVYCPCEASFTKDGQLLEGVGVTPDIEVHLDKAAWNNGLGPDSQLDRAIQYITTGK